MGSAFDHRFQRWYTEDVKRYDDRFQGAFAELEGELIVDLVAPRTGMTILDVGTGTGRASLALAAGSEATVVGLDLTRAMLRRAAQKRDEAGRRYPLFVCGNGRALPFDDETFDAVLSIRTLHLFPASQWQSFIDEMTRVLKPGGTLLVEFDSALAGFGWGFLRDIQRHWTRDKSRYYLWPHQIESLFAAMDSWEVYGFWLPGIGRMARRNERFGWTLRLARLGPPFGFLGNHVLVRGKKGGTSSACQAGDVQLSAVPGGSGRGGG